MDDIININPASQTTMVVDDGSRPGSSERECFPELGSKKRPRSSDKKSEKVLSNKPELDDFQLVSEDLLKAISSVSQEVSPEGLSTLLLAAKSFEHFATRILCENERLRGICDELRQRPPPPSFSTVTHKKAAAPSVPRAPPTTAGDATARPQRTKPQPKKSFALIVRAEDPGKGMTSDTIKAKVLKHVGKAVTDVRVKGVRNIRDGIAIDAASAEDLEKLRKCPKFKAHGLKVSDPVKQGPKMLIYGVPAELKDEDLIADIFDRNLLLKMQRDEFVSRTRVVTRERNKKDFGQVVIETSPKAKDLLEKQKRVYLNWVSCKIHEINFVKRCFNCHGFGHFKTDCKVKDKVCSRCSETGHEHKGCNKKECCRNCKVAKKADTGHRVTSRNCPLYKNEVRKTRARLATE